ncbi:cAMP-dependent protein kinase inhibitor gamma [Bufo gargarizans]|uniref:cAMP-dependent protein kinase inhibitor gamma n=1 Tax=Bufo bufo TaxID=8384 RepID=UPI001ABE7B75|nr:cAMP-dependent protein kinase inhibitor gamma [Bufo bufo]XP_040293398.1 cAMP-dependent protein kinase inhibitor gamma [Bufo bufo]XP_040293399.1 cAMP-dependent protein kinase inhibitor gamma [Bufo bufo]XP_044153448.1 cAMP-dependent protein kinase inhibitor gamma [Bufo gargarizans]XP_044153449.1 cAMP-dependent protein kinase inhibitor gamma [Bufo gargarizans]XP_044153450.1 cAMP-dependent protein kinase inhibitor gamma [Bufo gargarizans]XP_044153451.1 cAMP-dependent protein kinase inhibitor g
MDVESAYTEFITCDRTGRRNAVPDIKGGECGPAGVRELSENMGDLAIQGAEGQAAAASSNSGQEQTPEAQDGSSPS